jgi:hypothetical protein
MNEQPTRAQTRLARMKNHNLWKDYAAYHRALDGILKEAQRIEKDAYAPDLEIISGALHDIAADLRRTAQRVHGLAGERFREIEKDVDLDMASEITPQQKEQDS